MHVRSRRAAASAGRRIALALVLLTGLVAVALPPPASAGPSHTLGGILDDDATAYVQIGTDPTRMMVDPNIEPNPNDGVERPPCPIDPCVEPIDRAFWYYPIRDLATPPGFYVGLPPDAPPAAEPAGIPLPPVPASFDYDPPEPPLPSESDFGTFSPEATRVDAESATLPTGHTIRPYTLEDVPTVKIWGTTLETPDFSDASVARAEASEDEVSRALRSRTHAPVDAARKTHAALPEPAPSAPAPGLSSSAIPAGSTSGSGAPSTTLAAGLKHVLDPAQMRVFVAAAATGIAVILGIALYSLLDRRNLLRNEVRRRMHGTIEGQPGITMAQLARKVGVKHQTAAYHIHLLIKEGYVKEHKEGARTYFFANDGRAVDGARVLAPILHDAGALKALEIVQERPGIPKTEVGALMGFTRTAGIWHVKKLLRAGLVRQEGRRCALFVDAPRVGQLEELRRLSVLLGDGAAARALDGSAQAG